jgi:hypothetical protein
MAPFTLASDGAVTRFEVREDAKARDRMIGLSVANPRNPWRGGHQPTFEKLVIRGPRRFALTARLPSGETVDVRLGRLTRLPELPTATASTSPIDRHFRCRLTGGALSPRTPT